MERIGTAETPGGEILEIGESEAWTPWRLVSLAAQASLMMEFLRLAEAAALPVLGYVSSGEAMMGPSERDSAALVLSPCVVVENQKEADRAEKLLEEAMESSPVCRLLRGCTELDARLVVAMQVPA